MILCSFKIIKQLINIISNTANPKEIFPNKKVLLDIKKHTIKENCQKLIRLDTLCYVFL